MQPGRSRPGKEKPGKQQSAKQLASENPGKEMVEEQLDTTEVAVTSERSFSRIIETGARRRWVEGFCSS